MKRKKVLVSGCFDLLHAGHVAFLEEAATYGRLYVSLGSDRNIRLLKGRPPLFSEAERLFVLRSLACVEEAFIGPGRGTLDFAPALERIRPDLLVVNEDGNTTSKRALCRKQGIEYVVLKRTPPPGLPARSSTVIKLEMGFPYRIALAGGWIDQPWVSRLCPGSMVVASLKPTLEFQDRSGMATSSRRKAIEIWGDRLPAGNPLKLARLLFGAENPPGSRYISGSQDQIGLLVPGISRLHYSGDCWPDRVTTTRDRRTAEWLELVLHLIPLKPRPRGYDPIKVKHLSVKYAGKLGRSGEKCWQSILARDVRGLGESLSESLECWARLLPLTVDKAAMKKLASYSGPAGATFSGAGGGYIILASDRPVAGALKVKVRV